MTCSKISPALSRLLDQELSPRETAKVQSHLSECAACQALLKEWRLQGLHLRTHMRRLALGEDFVSRVMDSGVLRSGKRPRTSQQPFAWRNLMRWLPAAAAVLAAVLILSLLVPNRESVGYARVLDPGESLEVLPPSSSVWVRTAAGELLHPGDWLRNPVSGVAEILWRDCCHLTIESGTLTHIPAAHSESPDEVILLNGSLTTEIGTTGRDFQVRSFAGAVVAAGGRFAVRVRDWSLPQLEVSDNGSEVMSGVTLPVGEVSVGAGKVNVRAAQAVYDVGAGEAASFTAAMFGNDAGRPGSVDAAVSARVGSMEQGELALSLTPAPDGLRVRLTANNISLKRLLESATGLGVRGGEKVSVTGKLSYPAGATPASVAAAIGDALGVQIAFRQERIRKAAALARPVRLPARDLAPGRFRLEKSPEGRISFDFQEVPAGEAFRILRTCAADMPDLTLESRSASISMKASGLSSTEIRAWIERRLGLRITSVDLQADVIEVESDTPLPQTDREQVGLVIQTSVIPAAAQGQGQRTFADPGAGAAVAEGSFGRFLTGDGKTAGAPAAISARFATGSVWSLLIPAASPPAAGALPLLDSNSSAQAAKIRAKTPEYFDDESAASRPRASGHLIWPVLGALGAEGMGAEYLVNNAMGLSAHTIWNGYNRDGQLVAQCAILMPPSSTLGLVPQSDLPAALGKGGHWEMLSDIPVAAARNEVEYAGSAIGLPVEAERLSSRWSFPAVWLTKFGGRLWIVNPGAELTDGEAVILCEGRQLFSQRLILPPHASVIWPEPSSGVNPVAWGTTSGALARIEVRRGAVAAGLAR